MDRGLFRALEQHKDRTHYFVERLCQLTRISVPEALQITPSAARTAAGPGASSKLRTAVHTGGSELPILLLDIATFLEQLNRPTLAWRGLTLSQATREHENRLAYLRRMMASEEEFLEGRT